MAAWTTEQLAAIESNADLYVSPFREDGTVYVRAANGTESRWYQAAITQKAGRVRVGGEDVEVTFEAAGDDDEAAIDAAYEAKYPGSSAVPIMQGPNPKAASVRIAPRP